MRGATFPSKAVFFRYLISIHAPRAGSDMGCEVTIRQYNDFNPRSPCGERLATIQLKLKQASISIHAPRAGSDMLPTVATLIVVISIHAPRAGSDSPNCGIEIAGNLNFNPRSPCGERPDVADSRYFNSSYFNPRSPCGERPSEVSAS